MKTIKTLAMLAAATLVSASSYASIITYTDVDSYGTTVPLSNTQSFTGHFNILTGDGDPGDVAGYSAGSGLILGSGFGGITLTGFQGGNFQTYNFSLQGDFAPTPGFFVSVGAPGEPVLGTAFSILQATGKLDFTIQNTGSDPFYVTSAVLSVKGNRVPDGGATAMLIGAGILGLGALRRKVS